MNLKLSLSSLIKRRAIVALVVFLTVLVAFISVVKDVFADTASKRSEQHVLTVHDGDTKKGIYTDKNTLREALEEAGMDIQANDVTEPSLDEELVSGTYDVNIYRARAVTVVDGNNRTKVMSPYRTAKQIAKQADITLQDEDRVRLEKPTDVLRDGAMERLVIDRATSFTLIFYGKKTTSYTHAATVGEMLESKDITLGKKDKMSVKVSAPIKAGMKIEIWREGKQTITEEEAVDFPVRKIQDANREVGYRKVKTPGIKGERIATYEIVIKNGKEVSRKEIKSVTTKEPVEQVVIVGTKNNYSGSLNEWLRALRDCESGGNYQSVSGDYNNDGAPDFYGAYQFMPSTWNSIAAKSGRPDLVGMLPNQANPADQDFMIIANTNMTAGLRTQNPGCYNKLGLSNKPPGQ